MTDSSQAPPVAGTWYNWDGSLVIPASRWKEEYAAELEVRQGIGGGAVCLHYHYRRLIRR